MTIDPIIRQWALDRSFLGDRMAFISGPRQIGKTTLIQNHLRGLNQSHSYHNWDTVSLKSRLARNPLFFLEDISVPLSGARPVPPEKRFWVAFDEIHKYPKWKNLVKGYYDEWRHTLRFVVTGSARLDFFRRSGDSLVGRYFLFKMNPLHPHDLTGFSVDIPSAWHPRKPLPSFDESDAEFSEAARLLLDISGFPEPVAAGSRDFYLRWKDHHISLVTGEDIRDLTRIAGIQKLQTLLFLLPEKTGAPLSLNGLRETLQCSHAAVQSWLEAMEKVYLVFNLQPFTAQLKRSVTKERKYYFWDWGIHDDPGKKFENFLAVGLQRAVTTWNEWGKGEYRLMYVRTKDGREADFVVAEKNKPLLLVESKWNDTALSPSLVYFKNRLAVPLAVQVTGKTGYLRQAAAGVFVSGTDRFLKLLP